MDSPGFRAPFEELTSTAANNANNDNNNNTIDIDKKRKSIGRRVSFAAKAKVRYVPY